MTKRPDGHRPVPVKRQFAAGGEALEAFDRALQPIVARFGKTWGAGACACWRGAVGEDLVVRRRAMPCFEPPHQIVEAGVGGHGRQHRLRCDGFGDRGLGFGKPGRRGPFGQLQWLFELGGQNRRRLIVRFQRLGGLGEPGRDRRLGRPQRRRRLAEIAVAEIGRQTGASG